ncbi:MAG: addiction module protein, partial [Opitutaceae bacterium]|nr:addiction module protein [Opitutaceae bacterium]
MVTHFDALLKLPKNERMEVAEMLWLSVADEEALPVPALHKRVIDERLKRYRSGKSEPVPHSEMMQRL